LYVDGKLIKEFGEGDELFVPLAENGEPIKTAPRIKLADFIAGEEYETIQNAIELGLAEFGSGNWLDLKQVIGR
jgi:hypothetical protein